MRHINNAGLNLIKLFEGLELHAYDDGTGVWTIGYGHTRGVQPGQVITAAQAEAFLKADLTVAEEAVERVCHAQLLTDNEFASLVSFSYNAGEHNLRKLIRLGIGAVPSRLLLFNRAGGRVLAGLVRRRKAERELFQQAG